MRIIIKNCRTAEKYIGMVPKKNGFFKNGIFIELEDKHDECPICLENVILKKGFFDCDHSICLGCFFQLKTKICCLCRSQ
jgi:hypothetical protein